jgi:hypothetical protein
MTSRRLASALAIPVLGLLLVATACAAGSSTSNNSVPPTGPVAAFATMFDAGVGHRRLVLLMSPT